MDYYLCSLPDAKGDGAPLEIFSEDPDAIAAFIKRNDVPGRGIYQCIGKLRPGVRKRCKENVTELGCIVVDLDTRTMTESRDEILACLQGLALPPSEIRDSGRGLHAVWWLKEPVVDDAGMAEAEAIMKRMVVLLAGDPLPTHRAALLRLVGTRNSKAEGRPECRTIWKSSATPPDISEFGDLLDMYGDQPLLHLKPKANGHAAGFDFNAAPLADGPVDVEARLAAMSFEGAGDSAIHPTQLHVTAKLTGEGRPVEETVARVLAATRKAVANDPRCAGWNWQDEERTIEQMCFDLVNKAMAKNGEDLGHVLPDKLYDQWQTALAANRRPMVSANRGGRCVRSFPREHAPTDAGAAATPEDAAREAEPNKQEEEPKSPPPRIALTPFKRFDVKSLPRREWVLAGHYMLGIPTGTVAPGGAGKSNLSLVEAISMAVGRDLVYGNRIRRYRVWYHNAEAPLVEIHRRLAAICLHYELDMGDLEGWLFVTSGLDMNIKIAGGNGELRIERDTLRQIVEVIENEDIEIATFDPLIAMHTTGESDNVKMRQVCDEFAKIANATKCGVELVHHVRKKQPGQEEHTTADARGASAVIDAVRSARVLNQMSKTEAEKMGIDELDRFNYVRLDRGKANMGRTGQICWLKFETVTLSNGDEDEPGDDVGVITRWEPPDMRVPLTDADRDHFRSVVQKANHWRADPRADKWFGHIIAYRFGLDIDKPADRRRITAAWQQLLKERVLGVEERLDEKSRPREFVVPGGLK